MAPVISEFEHYHQVIETRERGILCYRRSVDFVAIEQPCADSPRGVELMELVKDWQHSEEFGVSKWYHYEFNLVDWLKSQDWNR